MRHRSPEIISEPVVHDDLLESLRRLDHQHRNLRLRTHSEYGPVIPSGLLLGVIDFVAYWQAVGPHLAEHGDRNRAEHEATFDLALAKAGLVGWTVYGNNGGDVYCCRPGQGRPVFTARWIQPDDSLYGHNKVGLGPLTEPCWHTESGAWSWSDRSRHATIADAIAAHVARITANA